MPIEIKSAYQTIPQFTENTENGYIDFFLSNFHKEINEFNNTDHLPDKEDYSFLLFLLIIWLKEYQEKVSIKYISPIHFKLIIQKSIGKDAITHFLKLFENLTLKRLQIIDNDLNNFWVINLYF